MSTHQTARVPEAGDWITLSTAAGPMRAFRVHPGGPARGGIVLLQEAFGVNAHICDLAARLAEAGYVTVAPELFHRQGVQTLDYAQHTDAVALISTIGAQDIIVDVRAAMEHLQHAENIAPARCAVVGFCFGGRAAFTAATALPNLGATVVFYGPGIASGPHAVLDRVDAMRAPIQLHVGGVDPTIPPEQVRMTAVALRAANVEFEQHVYADAGHAFVCDARPAMYRAEPAHTAWQRMLDFLAKHLPAA